MEQKHRHDIVHRECVTVFIHCTYSIRIAISRQSNESCRLNDASLQRLKVLIDRFGVNATEKWITVRPDRLDFEISVLQETLNPRSPRSMHRVDYYVAVSFAN